MFESVVDLYCVMLGNKSTQVPFCLCVCVGGGGGTLNNKMHE